MSISEKIKNLLDNDIPDSLSLDFYRKYHDQFKETGKHKAKSVINQIQSLREVPDLKKMVYISVGGSEGSELMWVLENTEVEVGVLMEIDSYACEMAKASSEKIASPKKMHIIAGDVGQQMGNLHALLKPLKDQGVIDGIIISANAIFHELPNRSQEYTLHNFLSELFWDFDNCVFICREPCKPFNWPEKVQLSIAGVTSDLMQHFCQDIQYKLNFNGQVKRCGPLFVELPSDLAVEAIHKLFYIEDYHYEIQERLTNINPDEFVAVVENILGKNSVFQVRLNSASFSQKYQEHNITARTIKGEPLTMPLSFFNIVASNQKNTTID